MHKLYLKERMKKMKKFISVLLTLMLVATTLPMSIVLADEIVASESLTQQDGVYLINNAADLKRLQS